MFKHIANVRHMMVVAVLACLGLATACAPAAQTKAVGQPHVKHVKTVMAQTKNPPTVGLKGILAYLSANPRFMGKSHAAAVGVVENALQLCSSGWNGLSSNQQAQLSAIAFTANQAATGSESAKSQLLVALLSQPRPCAPTINAVGPFEATATMKLEITGGCFGTGNTVSGTDTAYFRISDVTAGWNACWTGDPGTDLVTCKVSSWTNTTIIFSGFADNYGKNRWVIAKGDHIKIQVWNPQSAKGPATCVVIAGSGASTNC